MCCGVRLHHFKPPRAALTIQYRHFIRAPANLIGDWLFMHLLFCSLLATPAFLCAARVRSLCLPWKMAIGSKRHTHRAILLIEAAAIGASPLAGGV